MLPLCALALDNGVARLPPRGLTTWELFNFNVSDAALRALADEAVAAGLTAANYSVLWLDDGWPACDAWSGTPGVSRCVRPSPRASDGSIIPDPKKFPFGIKATFDYIHSRGMQVGIYTDPHFSTCGGYSGSLDHEAIDAQTFVAWGVDAVKLDAGCRDDTSLHNGTLLASIGRFRDALNATGKPVLLYVDDGNPISGAKVVNPHARGWPVTPATSTHYARSFSELSVSWCPDYANMCKLWFDRWDSFGSLLDNAHQQINMAWFQGPGTFLAPDQMTVGQGRMSAGEERAEVFLYAALAAPMFLSAAPSLLSPEQLALVTNPEILQVNSDPDCTMASNVNSLGGGTAAFTPDRFAIDVWVKPLSDGSFAFVVINKDPASPRNATVEFGDGSEGSDTDLFPAGAGTRARVRDLHARTDLGVFDRFWSVVLPPHDAAIVRVTPL